MPGTVLSALYILTHFLEVNAKKSVIFTRRDRVYKYSSITLYRPHSSLPEESVL